MRTNRWLIGALVASLIMNLLLVGFVAGRMSGFGPPHGVGPDPTVGFYRLLGFLNDQRRAAITPVLRKQMSAIVPLLRKIHGDQKNVFDALSADPFEPAALEAALADLRSNLSAAQIASHRSFVTLAESLTNDERKSLVRAMRRSPHMHRRTNRDDNSGHRDQTALGMRPGGSRDQPPQEDRQ